RRARCRHSAHLAWWNRNDHSLQLNAPDAVWYTENPQKAEFEREFLDADQRRRFGCGPVVQRQAFAGNAHIRKYAHVEIREFNVALKLLLQQPHDPIAGSQFRRSFLRPGGCKKKDEESRE